MRRSVRVAAFVLPLVLAVPFASRAQLPPSPAEAPAVEAPTLTILPAPDVELATKSLADEIFKGGLRGQGAIEVGYWGRCSQSCAICWSTAGCPPDDDGTPQFCYLHCP
jgi:hypothetical protein